MLFSRAFPILWPLPWRNGTVFLGKLRRAGVLPRTWPRLRSLFQFKRAGIELIIQPALADQVFVVAPLHNPAINGSRRCA